MIVPEINKRSINNMISIDKKKLKLAFDDLKAIKVIKSRNINKKILSDKNFIKNFIETNLDFIKISDNFHDFYYQNLLREFKKINRLEEANDFLNRRISNHHRLYYALLMVPKNMNFSWHAHANIEFAIVFSGDLFEVRSPKVISKSLVSPKCKIKNQKISKKGTLKNPKVAINEIGSIHRSLQ
tara:strand:- start:30 stop:581 length:552 start_codon:yes stop_codon:yes gene_type:complete